MKEWRASSTGSQMIPNLGECQPYGMMKDRAATEGSRWNWSARNLMRFDKIKCEVLHLGQNNPTYLLDIELNLSQQHVLEVKKAKCILGGISKNVGRMVSEVIFPLHSSLLGLHLECCVKFWPLQYKNMLTYRSEPS